MTGSAEFKAGIAVAAVTDWRYYDTKWAEAFMKRPQDNPEGYDATSHARRAKNLSGRLLLVHGTYDDNVHPQNAWRFAEELIQAGITFEMMMYPMRKHGIADDAAQRHLYRIMLEFWERTL
jgi:dipeptidyl-peptidase-4